jgi:hypothetical protein
MARLAVPSMWRQGMNERLTIATDGASDDGFDSEDGEELGAVEEGRRRQLAQSTNRNRPDNSRRLSRE